MKTKIVLECLDQSLSLVEGKPIASGGRNENAAKFFFCSMWDGLAKTAVFYRLENEPYHMPLDLNNECDVPHEVTDEEGTFYMGVFGVSEEQTKTSNIIKITLQKGAITKISQPSDPTPDIWEQLIGESQNVQQIAKEHLLDTSNPHKVTKDQVGLGNVPNVSTNDQAPTFDIPELRTNLVSGDKLSVLFGKIAKFFTDLKDAAFCSIANNLSETETGKVLDARQGKVLLDKINEEATKTIRPINVGGTGANNRKNAFENIAYLGIDPTTADGQYVEFSDPELMEQLGSFYAYVSEEQEGHSYPTMTGIIVNHVANHVIHQTWIDEHFGNVYKRCYAAGMWNGNDTLRAPDAWAEYITSDRFAVVTGTMPVPVDGNLTSQIRLPFPDGFTYDNCVVVSTAKRLSIYDNRWSYNHIPSALGMTSGGTVLVSLIGEEIAITGANYVSGEQNVRAYTNPVHVKIILLKIG